MGRKKIRGHSNKKAAPKRIGSFPDGSVVYEFSDRDTKRARDLNFREAIEVGCVSAIDVTEAFERVKLRRIRECGYDGSGNENEIIGLACRHVVNSRHKVMARSASDKTDDWPYWMVWDGRLNVTGTVANVLGYPYKRGAGFFPRVVCERLANEYNSGPCAPGEIGA